MRILEVGIQVISENGTDRVQVRHTGPSDDIITIDALVQSKQALDNYINEFVKNEVA